MKKWSWGIAAVVVLTVFLKLGFGAFDGRGQTEEEEFLFDTRCTITAYSKSAQEGIDAAFDQIAHIHKLTNFFDKESEVSRINNAAAGEPVSVSREVMEIIKIAEEVRRESGGAFDICLAGVSELWKKAIDSQTPPEEDKINAALSVYKNSGIEIDEKAMTVTKKTTETKIDLGGVAKGYAGDEAVRVLKERGVECGVVDLGGNVTCFGKNPKNKQGIWKIGLQKPFSPTGEYDEVVEITEGAVVTSGKYQRYFEYDGEVFHHIVDPQTGGPAMQDFDSVTVVGTNSALADCIATGAFVLGREKGEMLAKHYNVKLYFK